MAVIGHFGGFSGIILDQLVYLILRGVSFEYDGYMILFQKHICHLSVYPQRFHFGIKVADHVGVEYFAE